MRHVAAKDPFQVSRPRTIVQSRHSALTVRTHRSAKAFARGARIGVWMTSTPSVRNTSSNGPEYFESRSWIKNLARVSRSSSAGTKFLACCVTHAESGCAVTPAKWMRLVESSMKNSTYSVFNPDSLHSEEVGSEDAVGLGSQELRLARAASSWSRSQALLAKERPDGRRTDPEPELSKLALDPHAPPPGVLLSQTKDQLADLGI